MESVSFLSLCRVTVFSMYDRAAENVRRLIAGNRDDSAPQPGAHCGRSSDDRREVHGAKAKPALREPFKPLIDLALHTDD